MTERRHSVLGLAFAASALLVAMLAIPALGATPKEPTDQKISDVVDTDLSFDPAVPAHRIDVRTNEGIVTLSGSVDNLLAKDRAERIAETIRGVRSVVNTIEVDPLPRSDDEIRLDVAAALAADPATDLYEIEVAVDGGKVTLKGTVESWREKDLAERVAKGVRGVIGLANEIGIEYASDRPDTEIRTEIQQALRWDRLVDHALIDVRVSDGAVTLTGTVGSLAERRRARIDSWTAGVESVDDSGLEVAYWTRDDRLRADKFTVRSDAEVQASIKDALLYDPRVASFAVDVDVESGMATLRGVVDSVEAKQAAARTARNTVGVWHVKNLVKVRPENRPTDEELARRVRGALARDPYVERFDVDTKVSNGIVYLSGAVGSYFEKAQAETAASRINGTVDVVNNISVSNADAPLLYDPYVSEIYPPEYGWYAYDPAPPFQPDWIVRSEIQDELWWSPFVDADDVEVSVEDGIATLTGEVDTWSERSAAVENAYEGGAISVIDRLDVDFGPGEF